MDTSKTKSSAKTKEKEQAKVKTESVSAVSSHKEKTDNSQQSDSKKQSVNGFDPKESASSNGSGSRTNSLHGPQEGSNLNSKSDWIKSCILQSVRDETKQKIQSLINEISQLSDVEKLYLYLQLPTGTPSEADSLKPKSCGNPLGKKADAEVAQTYTWIQTHLEEDPDVSLPKQEVYEEYWAFFEKKKITPLCAADFGKVMKHVFPTVRPRRLGTRGNSRYCYSGLRKKIEVQTPKLPDLSFASDTPGIKDKAGENCEDEFSVAASHLIFEWAEKLLNRKFHTLKDLAYHLVENMYVDNRSVAAFTILSAASKQCVDKGASNVSNIKQTGSSKRREAQYHLQRKLHEKERIREQKRKLVEQRSQMTQDGQGKLTSTKKTQTALQKKDCLPKSTSLPHESREEDGKNDKTGKVAIPRNGNMKSFTNSNGPKVCLPNFIIVPPLQKMQISEAGKQDASSSTVSASPSKYKRIQPKPISFKTVTEEKEKADSMETSEASDKSLSSELTEAFATVEKLDKLGIGLESYKKVEFDPIPVRCSNLSTEISNDSESFQDIQSSLEAVTSYASHINEDSSGTLGGTLVIDTDAVLSSDLLDNSAGTMKRHSEESEPRLSLSKRLHLDSVSSGSLLNSWPGEEDTTKEASTLVQIKEEMSIHQLEKDALTEYLNETDFGQLKPGMTQVATNAQKATAVSKSQSSSNSENKTAQLSQLRMLLERNLPHTNLKSVQSTSKQTSNDNVSKAFAFKTDSATSETSKAVSQLAELHQALSNDLGAKQLSALSQNSSSTVHWKTNTWTEAERDATTDSLCQAISNNQDLVLCAEELAKAAASGETSLQVPCGDAMPASNVVSNAEYGLSNTVVSDLHRVSIHTQVPSVPPSPNTRNRFFMPISPQHTLPEGLIVPNTSSTASPVPQATTVLTGNMISIAVGTSQPPSAASSPFVSPRSTPVPWSRSRHSSGQSAYSTPRQTPFQNIDSGVSSVSSSPFISPQSTPVIINRMRHNSSYNPSKVVTFSNGNSPHMTQNTNLYGNRSRHSSGPGGPPIVPATQLMSPRSAPMSPMVGECSTQTNFSFPSLGDTPTLRSRHNSASSVTPMSPQSAPLSPLNPPLTHMDSHHVHTVLQSDDGMGNLSHAGFSPNPDCTSTSALSDTDSGFSQQASPNWLPSKLSPSNLKTNPRSLQSQNSWSGTSKTVTFWPQTRQRHASGSVIQHKAVSSLNVLDPLSSEVQSFMKNATICVSGSTNRSRSVPLHQMFSPHFPETFTPTEPPDESFSKSYPTTPVLNQSFNFPSANQVQPSDESACNSSNTTLQVNHQIGKETQQEDVLLSMAHTSEWNNLETVQPQQRNFGNLFEDDFEDELQTTIDDLRDCDNDFSKFAKELDFNAENEDDMT